MGWLNGKMICFILYVISHIFAVSIIDDIKDNLLQVKFGICVILLLTAGLLTGYMINGDIPNDRIVEKVRKTRK